MRSKTITLALTAVLLLALLAGCDNNPPAEAYPGELNVAFPLGDMFTINAAKDLNGQYKWVKYVICEVTLEVSDATFIQTLTDRLYRVREIVNFSIGSKQLEQIDTEDRQRDLLEEIKDKINEEFNTTAVDRAFFDMFAFHS